MNNVVLKGRLVADPELRQTASGIAVVSFTIAIDKYTGKDGEKSADFIGCNAWRGTAEFISKYFTKGQEILIRGQIHNKNWESNGVKHFSYEVTAENAEFCGSKAGNAQPQQNNSVPADFDPNGFEEILSDQEIPF
jgi:single-strand DNA-binding protein